jgi:hypothetical protein
MEETKVLELCAKHGLELNFNLSKYNTKVIDGISIELNSFIRDIFTIVDTLNSKEGKKGFLFGVSNIVKTTNIQPIRKRTIEVFKTQFKERIKEYFDLHGINFANPYCNAKEMKTDLSQLCESCPLAEKIQKGIEEQIVFEASEQKEILTESQFKNYLNTEVLDAQNAMKDVRLFEMQDKGSGVENQSFQSNRTKVYIWNKERIKALNGFSKDLEKPKQIAKSQKLEETAKEYRENYQPNLESFKNEFEADESSSIEIEIEQIKNSENKFWPALPMTEVIDHFKIMTEKKSKSGQPFLAEKQFISFLKRGFLNDETEPKQKINFAYGEKGLVINRFYQFFELLTNIDYGFSQKEKQKIVSLILNCFSNSDFTKSSISELLKPNKSKKKW